MLISPLSTAMEAVEPPSAFTMPTAATAAPAAELGCLTASESSDAQQQQDTTEQQQLAAEANVVLAPNHGELELQLQIQNVQTIAHDTQQVQSKLLSLVGGLKSYEECYRQHAHTVMPDTEADQSVTAGQLQQVAATSPSFTAHAVPAAYDTMLTAAGSTTQQKQHGTTSQQQHAAGSMGMSDSREAVQRLTILLQLQQKRSDASADTLREAQQLLQSIQQLQEGVHGSGMRPAALFGTGNHSLTTATAASSTGLWDTQLPVVNKSPCGHASCLQEALQHPQLHETQPHQQRLVHSSSARSAQTCSVQQRA
jgi:hypothetical protein